MVREAVAVAVAVECAQAASVVTDVEEEAIGETQICCSTRSLFFLTVTETEEGGSLVLLPSLRVCTVSD